MRPSLDSLERFLSDWTGSIEADPDSALSANLRNTAFEIGDAPIDSLDSVLGRIEDESDVLYSEHLSLVVQYDERHRAKIEIGRWIAQVAAALALWVMLATVAKKYFGFVPAALLDRAGLAKLYLEIQTVDRIILWTAASILTSVAAYIAYLAVR